MNVAQKYRYTLKTQYSHLFVFCHCNDITFYSLNFSLILGSFGGIRLYMTELIAITQKALQSQSWKMKAQGAAAMATVAKEQTGSLVAPHLGMVLTALMQGLSGRTWAGKVTTDYTTAGKKKEKEKKLFCFYVNFNIIITFLFQEELLKAIGSVVSKCR